MAVFPDRIILKSTTDSDSSVVSQIESGGASEIKPGELVIRRDTGKAFLYALDANGNPVIVSSEVDQASTLLNHAVIKLAFNTAVTDDTPVDSSDVTTSPFPSATAAKFGDRGLEVDGSESIEGAWSTNPGRIFSFGFWMQHHVVADASFTGYSVVFTQAVGSSLWQTAFGPNVEIVRGQDRLDDLASDGHDTTGMVRGCLALFSAQQGSNRRLLVNTQDFSCNDGAWHYYLFQGEAGGNYAVYVDGVLKQRQQNATGEITWEANPWSVGSYGTSSTIGTDAYFDGITWFANINQATGSSHVVPGADPEATQSILHLDNLQDVIAPSPSSSDILSYNGQHWVNIPSAGNPNITFLDDLLDVDTSLITSQDGQILVWNETDQEWQRASGATEVSTDLSPALGGPLDVGLHSIFTTANANIIFDSQGLGGYEFKQNVALDTPAQIKLMAADGIGSVILSSHLGTPGATNIGDTSSYTITFPYDPPTALGDVLTYQGDGTYEFSAPVVEWSSILNAPYVPAFGQQTPVQGDALRWNATTSQYEPTSIDSGSTAGLSDLSDVVLTEAAGLKTGFEDGDQLPLAGNGTGELTTAQAFQGTQSFKILGATGASGNTGGGYYLPALKASAGLYDIYSMRVYASGIRSGVTSWSVPIHAKESSGGENDNNIRIVLNNTEIHFDGGGSSIKRENDHPSPTPLVIDSWNHVFFQIYYKTGRTWDQDFRNLPAETLISVYISVWVNGEKWLDNYQLSAIFGSDHWVPEDNEETKKWYLSSYLTDTLTVDEIYYDKFYGWNSQTPYLAMDSGDIADVDALEAGLDALFVQEQEAGDALVWDGTVWRPGESSGTGGITSVDIVGGVGISSSGGPITSSGAITVDLENTAVTPGTYTNANITVDAQGRITFAEDGSAGGGGGGASASYMEDTQTSNASGLCTFTGIGTNGTLVNVSSVDAAWIVLYTTDAARTADSGRGYGDDPALGSGVLAEFYVSAGGEVLATPGTSYFNADDPATEAIYVAVRDQAGAAVSTDVTIAAYGVAPTIVGQRSAKVSTTASLADGTSEDVTISGAGRSGRLVSIETDVSAWVVVYSDTASRTADASRDSDTDPAPGSGVLCEVLTTGAQKIKLTPSVGYFNDESPSLSELYLKVENRSGGSSTVTVTTTLVPAEA